MKRFLSLLLIFALLCTAMLALASCGPDDTPDDPIDDGQTPPETPPDDTPKGTIDVVTDPNEAKNDPDTNYVKENA